MTRHNGRNVPPCYTSGMLLSGVFPAEATLSDERTSGVFPAEATLSDERTSGVFPAEATLSDERTSGVFPAEATLSDERTSGVFPAEASFQASPRPILLRGYEEVSPTHSAHPLEALNIKYARGVYSGRTPIGVEEYYFLTRL